MSDDKDEKRRQVDALHHRLEAGEITMREYNRQRLEILEGKAPQARAHAPQGWGDSGSATKKSSAWTKVSKEKAEGTVETHAPTGSGIGDGKLFAILFGFAADDRRDQSMRRREREALSDDIEVLKRAGYTVIVHSEAKREDLLAVLESKVPQAPDLKSAGFYWSSHGNADGSLNCSDRGRITFGDVRKLEVAPELRLAVLGACYVGRHSNTWRRSLGGHPLVVGWGRPVTISRALDFLTPSDETDHDFDDLLRRFLLADAPIPPLRELAARAAVPAAMRCEGLEERMQAVEVLLGVPSEKLADRYSLQVNVDGGRSRCVEVFISDSARPFSEGEPLVGARTWVGPLTTVAEASKLLLGFGEPGLSQLALLQGEGELPELVAQGFLPLSAIRDRDLLSLVHQVASHGDALAQRIFGTNDE